METTRQHEELLEMLDRIADALESISDKQGAIANSLLQLRDLHGSNTPGPY
jgi:septation ring formation regulator EzrA